MTVKGRQNMDDNAGTGHVPKRRGWQLPTQRRSPDAEDASASFESTDPIVGPRPALSGSVVGQVTDVVNGSLQANQSSTPIVTFRLERHDPHEGRVQVASVRLAGADAVGFVKVGDWVEVVGKRENAHIDASRAVNHTTSAVYKQSASARLRIALAVIGFLIFVAIMFGGFLYATDRDNDAFDRRVDQQRQDFDRQVDESRRQSEERCLASGAPQQFCQVGP